MATSEASSDGAYADEAAVRGFPLQMIDAWNAGDGTAFAAPFSDTADFIAFEGTHLERTARLPSFTSSGSTTSSREHASRAR